MIEVAFNGSVVGNLKAASAYYNVFADANEGTDIIWLEFILSIGYIDNDILGEYRTSLPGELIMFRQTCDDARVTSEENNGEKDFFGKRNREQWERFLKDIEICDKVRIWISRTAESMCGLLFLCDYLQDKGIHILIAECPSFMPENNDTIFFWGWEQSRGDTVARYISNTRELSQDEIRINAKRWDILRRENAPLRALISGNIVSVDEDFYDFLIRKHFPEGDFKQGAILDKFYNDDIYVPYYWLDRRMEHMIENGELEIIADNKNQHKRILRIKRL